MSFVASSLQIDPRVAGADTPEIVPLIAINTLVIVYELVLG